MLSKRPLTRIEKIFKEFYLSEKVARWNRDEGERLVQSKVACR